MTEPRNSLGSENAFPVHCFDTAEWRPGMTMRDFLAAKAMQSVIASSFGTPQQPDGQLNEFPSRVAKWSYLFADAMLRERDRNA